jgi:hypothetical protein
MCGFAWCAVMFLAGQHLFRDEKGVEAMAETGTLWSPWLGYLGAKGRHRSSVHLYDFSPSHSLQLSYGGLDVLARMI